MLKMNNLSWLVLAFLCWSGFAYSHSDSAILQGDVHVVPAKPLADHDAKIQPGTPVKLSMTVENKGHQASAAGEVYIRYAFSKPLESDRRSVIYETEKVSLPSLAPHEKFSVDFQKEHVLPALIDFIRDDWSMRDYQAIVEMDGTQKVIGTLAITVSAYYYPGIRKEIPAVVPSEAKVVSP